MVVLLAHNFLSPSVEYFIFTQSAALALICTGANAGQKLSRRVEFLFGRRMSGLALQPFIAGATGEQKSSLIGTLISAPGYWLKRF
jgi:hypothetical protein